MYKSTKVAINTAKKATELLKRLVDKKQDIKIKEAGIHADIVTKSDIAAEKLIIEEIRKYFPSHGILSEETSPRIDPKKHKHLWIIDPIDGTIVFAAGLPFYSISISYFVNQEPVSSALYLAATDEILWCETKKGAYVGKKRIFIHDLPIEKSVIALDQGVRTRKLTMSTIAPTLPLSIRALLMIPGEAGNLGLVARGNIQGLLCSHPQIWDYAAGIHLVKEAGGIVSDYAGNPYPWFTRAGHIACTPSVHSYLLEHAQKLAKNFS